MATLLEAVALCQGQPVRVALCAGGEGFSCDSKLCREAFLDRDFSSLADLNRQLDTWIEHVAHRRQVPREPDKLVLEALVEEQARLLPLPEHPFIVDTVRVARSGKTPYVRFDGNDYCIPHTAVRKPLTRVASDTLVRLLDRQTEIARHARSWDKQQQIEDERHLQALAAQKHKARESRGRNCLFAACSGAADFLTEVARNGRHLGGTTSRLLRLLDQFGPAALQSALVEAHGRGAFPAHSVAHVLERQRRDRGCPIPLSVTLPNNPRVQDLVVTPHSLERYDRLGQILDPSDTTEASP